MYLYTHMKKPIELIPLNFAKSMKTVYKYHF